MRKICILLLCALLLTSFASAQEGDSIQSLEASVTVDSDGACHVSVQAQVYFATAPKQFVFPLGTDADDISAGGAAYEEESFGDVECVVFENSIGFSGTQSFLCTYTLPCNMTEDGAGQYFSLQLPERGFDLPIEKFSLILHVRARARRHSLTCHLLQKLVKNTSHTPRLLGWRETEITL